MAEKPFNKGLKTLVNHDQFYFGAQNCDVRSFTLQIFESALKKLYKAYPTCGLIVKLSAVDEILNNVPLHVL